MKEKYDREGVEFIEDEMDMPESASESGVARGPSASGQAETLKGMRKPGQTSSYEGAQVRKINPNFNMGGAAEQDNQKNPLSLIINAAKKTIGKD